MSGLVSPDLTWMWDLAFRVPGLRTQRCGILGFGFGASVPGVGFRVFEFRV